jgi:hypothetical protein
LLEKTSHSCRKLADLPFESTGGMAGESQREQLVCVFPPHRVAIEFGRGIVFVLSHAGTSFHS